MLPTSGTYDFQSIPVDYIIREAYECVGITGAFVEPEKIKSARFSLNLLLLEWINKGINSWSRRTGYLALTPNQAQYSLSETVSSIIQANIRTSTRQLNGNPAASAGVAADAFDGNPATTCNAGINGNISYDYGLNQQQLINFLGVQSQTTVEYNLVFEYSQDNANWVVSYTIPAQTFNAGIISWFDIPVPLNARAYRIRETNGADLNIQELYFNNNTLDIPISNISRYEYLTYPTKWLAGRPSVYYFDKQYYNPVLNIWPVPSSSYNCLQYSYEKVMQDVNIEYLANTIEIPSLFYPPLVWGLAMRLALKFNPSNFNTLQVQYQTSYEAALTKNSETVPIEIQVDYSSGGDW